MREPHRTGLAEPRALALPELLEQGLLAKKSGKMFRVGIFLDFVWLTTRTPHGAYVRRARRNRIDHHGGEIERLALQAHGQGMASMTNMGYSYPPHGYMAQVCPTLGLVLLKPRLVPFAGGSLIALPRVPHPQPVGPPHPVVVLSTVWFSWVRRRVALILHRRACRIIQRRWWICFACVLAEFVLAHRSRCSHCITAALPLQGMPHGYQMGLGQHGMAHMMSPQQMTHMQVRRASPGAVGGRARRKGREGRVSEWVGGWVGGRRGRREGEWEGWREGNREGREGGGGVGGRNRARARERRYEKERERERERGG